MNDPVRQTPAEWAELAAEAIRQLNHATINLNADGYRSPGEVDETLAHLQALVERLPQALAQMTRWLDRQARAGLVRHDAYPVQAGREVPAQQALAAVREMTEDLTTAAAWLAAVARQLDQARNQSSHLAAFFEDLPDDPDDNAPADGGDVERADEDGAW